MAIRNDRTAWTAAEDEKLRLHWPTTPLRKLALQFPGRTHQSIYMRGIRIGLTSKQRQDYWSPEDVQRLRTLWRQGTLLKVIASELDRTRGACAAKAGKIGLKRRMKLGAHGRDVSVRLPSDLHRKAESYAMHRGQRITDYIRAVLARDLEMQ